MSVKFLRHADPEYATRKKQIIDIYNEDAVFPQSGEFVNEDQVAIIGIEGVAGGLILNRNTDGKWRIMYASLEEHARGRGFIEYMLQSAPSLGIDIGFVDVDSMDEARYWKRHGFDRIGMLMGGTCMVVANRKFRSFATVEDNEFKGAMDD